MSRANQDIRINAKAAGVNLWEIAELLQITDSNFSRKLRRELPTQEKAGILAIIDELRAERERVLECEGG